YARGQLLKKKVNTTDISRINTAGEVDLVVFDKTGTLTELGVDILCFDTIKRSFEKIEDIDTVARMALSTCHYVVELDNQYSGDILDMKMFLFSQSKIFNRGNRRFVEMEVVNKYHAVCKEYGGKEDECTVFFNAETSSSSTSVEQCPEDTLEILRIYDFDLYLKRISVVVKNNEGRVFVFSKGAPDSMRSTLRSVPDSYVEKVRDYGLEGYRVLTVAYREATEHGSRETDESGLEFLGFLVFANKLKEETEKVIGELREAELRPKMCTGDNILTAISVAKECGMIDKTTPVLFPVLEEGCKSVHDVEWFCVADED
ncbi:HAD ATPase, P-type, family IC, partial [Vittaforma corneae ATCC 50505]